MKLSKKIMTILSGIMLTVMLTPMLSHASTWEYVMSLLRDPVPEGVICIQRPYSVTYYDGHGNIISEQQRYPNSSDIYNTDYSYDQQGRIIQIAYHSSHSDKITYTYFSYDSNGKLSKVSDSDYDYDNSEIPVEYDSSGNLKELDLCTYEYDANGRLIVADLSMMENPVYYFTYDDAGNLSQKCINGFDCDDIYVYNRDASGKITSIDVTCPYCCTTHDYCLNEYIRQIDSNYNYDDPLPYISYSYVYYYNAEGQIDHVDIVGNGNVYGTEIYTYQ